MKTFTQTRIEERRLRVSELYLSGLSQRNIATQLGIPRTTVQSDLNALRMEWRTKTSQNYDESISNELSKIDLIESTAWDAWESSKLNSQKETVKTRRFNDNIDGTTVQIVETTKITETVCGDEGFLKRVAWCIEARCRILGLDRG